MIWGLKLLTFGESDEEGARTVCFGSNAVRGKIVRVLHTNRGLGGGNIVARTYIGLQQLKYKTEVSPLPSQHKLP